MDYSLHYYDVVLLVVFASVALGAGVGTLTTVPVTSAVSVAALVAVAVVGHALFVNGPVDDPADLTEEVDGLN